MKEGHEQNEKNNRIFRVKETLGDRVYNPEVTFFFFTPSFGYMQSVPKRLFHLLKVSMVLSFCLFVLSFFVVVSQLH